jgi:hypothetical protein
MRDTSTVAQAMPAIVAVLRPSLFSATEGGLLEENAPEGLVVECGASGADAVAVE